mgnify:CR=1 FL=1|jgi:ATP-binding cassette, subfamily B, bacterial MsbA
MIFLKKLESVLSKYIQTFQIAKIRKKNYFFVIFLTLLTVILDAAGISILLPIGEYVLSYETGKVPDTYAWKLLKDIFLYLNLKPDILLIVGFAVIVIFLRQIVVFTRAIIIDIIRFKAVKDFREKLFVKFLRQDLYYIKQYSTGIYNNVINLEVDNVGKAIVLPLENVSGIILIVSYLSLMMFISIQATLIVMAFMILTGLLLKNILYYIKRTANNIIKINNKFSQNLVDRLIAIKLIRVSNKINKEEEQNKEILSDQFINNVKLSRIQRIIDSAIEPMLLMVAIPVIIIAIKLNFPLAQLGVFIILLARFIPVFRVTVISIQGHFSYYASISNMLKLIDKVDSQKEMRTGSLDAPKYFKSIKFNNIYFNYDKSEKNILNNFSCEVKGGKVNVLIGTSGSGKTTIVNMIPRLLDPNKGKILINDINLNKINVDKIRDVCAYIEQKPTFIRGTILEHISYNKGKVKRKNAEEAAKLANAHNFIMNLEKNYDHLLGESGVGLSGGQLQRLDITRGLASEKPLMILDEPTSNLDKKNTKDLLLTLRKINKIKNTTIIIVSHDTSILKYCDNIIKI